MKTGLKYKVDYVSLKKSLIKNYKSAKCDGDKLSATAYDKAMKLLDDNTKVRGKWRNING